MLQLFSFKTTPTLHKMVNMCLTRLIFFAAEQKKTNISLTWTNASCHFTADSASSIVCWNVLGAFQNWKSNRTKRYSPLCEVKSPCLGLRFWSRYAITNYTHPLWKRMLLPERINSFVHAGYCVDVSLCNNVYFTALFAKSNGIIIFGANTIGAAYLIWACQLFRSETFRRSHFSQTHRLLDLPGTPQNGLAWSPLKKSQFDVSQY